ncbi:MAG: TAT-variant-translocated molybdopterin oxidoreductase [Bdellovibrionaceae bacterium]|nr:TAT-variant-translocated molybdopterin oxidoreductase [Pseudobdellovibrionaceae bacterium]
MEIKTDYWKSLDEKYQTPEFLQTLENEFLSSPLKSEDGKDGLARRQFMKLMGASVALTAAACVRRPVQKIIPYNKRPGDLIVGLPNYYASAYFDGTEGISVRIKTREGRPLFVAGLNDNPLNGRGLSARASAHLLSLYDPDRVQKPTINSINPKNRKDSISVGATWEKLDTRVVAKLKEGGVGILTTSNPSPASQELLHKFTVAVGGSRYTWDPLPTDSVRKAQQLSYGTDLVPAYHFDKAAYIVSIDGDFLGTYLTPVKFTNDFAKARNPDGNMARLVSFHSIPSLTTLNADDNYPIRASHQLAVACSLLKAVAKAKDGSISEAVSANALSDEQLGLNSGTIDYVAKNLVSHAGQGIVISGGMVTESANSVALQVVINSLNSLLGNEGKTITTQGAARWRNGSSQDLLELVKDIESGKVTTLIVHDINPMYAFPAEFKFSEVVQKLKGLITTTNWIDETATLADVIAPCGHPMENWNEYEFATGLKTIQQPTIRPINDTRSFEDSLIAWAKAFGKPITSSENYHDHLKADVVKALGSEKNWFDYLQSGSRGSVSSGSGRSFNSSAYSALKDAKKSGNDIELVLYPKAALLDGALANVSWLQELPDPVTKTVWDNYLTVSPQFAKEKHLKMGSMVEIEVSGQKLNVPVYVMPGQNSHVVGLAVGYGRTKGMNLAKNIGVNAYTLAKVDNEGVRYSGLPVKVQKIMGTYELAITQGHNSMEGRQIIAESSLKNYKEGTDPVHRHKVFSIWDKHKYDGNKWGMAIDLNTCTGCSACMVACYSENNIPVVGKKYVLQGREMHWIRIDRYYKGDESAPDAVFQPVMCQHCENAPCETVCPVLATVHSDEGLNDMVYNRCVGTRYCSNNCPYKVRRFNWFYYDSHYRREPLEMALNPDVTVRTRGVMEKCTFCVQRIKDAKSIAKVENRPLQDGEIKTACQEACPTGVIVFGDLNDKESAVSKMFEAQRQYTLLEEVNAAPRVRYMAKIRNTDRIMSSPHHEDHTEKHSNGHANKEEHT